MTQEEPKTGQTLSALAHFGFTDLGQSAQRLDELSELSGIATGELLAVFSKAANPDQALRLVLGLIEVAESQVLAILRNAESTNRLVKLTGLSTALTDFLVRHPEFLATLNEEPDQLPTKSQMNESLSQVQSASTVAEQVTTLRKAYREQLLRISLFDLAQENQVETVPLVAKSLAELAAAALDAGLVIARGELVNTKDFGDYSSTEVDATKLAVIGMGKGGAGELNYISDVDVIFVAEADPSVEPERMLEIATKLATRMMRAMDQANVEPALWQVDANLRPEGKSGALVRTLDSHIAYYSKWAENWEFQALLKATPMAGDMELGARYQAAMQQFIWSSSKRENFVESVQRMRERVSENIPKDEAAREIKLGIGGLRDIEFTVQLLQLVHGRMDDTVHAPDTITAIRQLSDGGYIGRVEAAEFTHHYMFLRLLEHRIQMTNMRRSHLMPATEDMQRTIARSINLQWSASELLSAWQAVKSDVRALHQRIFYRPLLNAVAKNQSEFMLGAAQALDRLAAIGFIDPAGALIHIEALSNGLSRRSQIQRQLLPVLLELLGQGTDPDAALLAFRRLSENLGESPWYLRMLRDSSGAAERLTTALSLSKFATAMLEQTPEAAAWFDDPSLLRPTPAAVLYTEAEALSKRYDDLDEYAKSIRFVRRRETLRLALGVVVGELDFAEISVGLTELTEWYLSSLVRDIVDSQLTASEYDLGIIAMGRFGGGELVFGSDADLMVVYQADNSEGTQAVVEKVISDLKRLSRDPQLEFEIDMDLRPEGKNGAVARSMESYRAYYARWADIWENQALLRARMVYGSDGLRRGFDELVDKYRYPEELADAAIIEIRRIKARVENERLPQGADPKRHLKLGRGSLSDIEWLVQLLQLKHGQKYPGIRTPQTLPAIDALVRNNLLEAHDARVLIEAWTLTSRIRSAIVLCSGKRSDVLPTDRKQLEAIARILGRRHGSATALEEDYLAATRRARMVFERVFFQ